MLKKIGIAIVVLLAVVVVALYVGPKLYDWNSHKADIAARVKAATGRDLTIDGDISASLLFTPTLSVSGVRFANAPGGSAPEMASFENLKVRVALGPLLSGDIKVESIVLVRPTILLERYADGTAN
ncbi:MAG: AsmA family protein, partial [Rhodospirillaceae bacterium]|nr:AsmA family protein [Rhodospirillaceae bacterium]